jgi:hypothetical protein
VVIKFIKGTRPFFVLVLAVVAGNVLFWGTVCLLITGYFMLIGLW